MAYGEAKRASHETQTFLGVGDVLQQCRMKRLRAAARV